MMNLFLTKENVAIHYNTKGSGYPIILLHGVFQDMDVFEPLIKKLSKNYQVISIDLRGHGLSDTPHDSRVDDYISDIQQLLNALFINSAYVIGLELGATIATGLTYKNPDLINGMVLINPTDDHSTFPDNRIYDRHADEIRTMSDEDKEKYLLRFRYKNIKQAKKFVKSHIPSNDLQTMEEEIAVKRSFKDFDIISLLPDIETRTLVISGQYDGKILYREGKRISELLPNAEFKLFEGSGELPFIEEKEKFFGVLEEFLS
ncbi:alpha/beta fold hydrolase [Mammaliicoccus sciuri]|uniref:alpha/beta fold hydrolase n=1 Tax=Mammaliicoccus sciuri TaxID=1296 RepID=UPI001E5DD6D9|nr:alpha/beta hydrolase [Mammaliicoccus sciuri]MCD3219940.1 alpha/beta hydrolase [Mammaliicoccus sciuri]MCJ0908446.1 alpha/beta hydrolase [Mammaliicoccus sciuri]MCJ0922043.1 alpha/beta hydrolase [Mammaliicoccus sciuri]MCJ1760499.1 alpha/beta hydrolase [Mammaliicoccus sciuri]MEB6119315.1 alpha/beta hydrolase [Mammaliicoccus sciuri]